jgi:FhuF 2Fe-2S C-terminal domain/Ferric iron reductase FhuF-like transporter
MNTHPLQQTLAKAQLLSGYLKPQIGQPSGEGWIAALEAFAPHTAHLDRLIAVTQARLRTTAPTIIASALLQDYQWPLLSTAIACFLLDRRVPDISVASCRVRYNPESEADALALGSRRFSALPDDPAANHPDATIVPDLAALRATLRTSIEAHLGMVIGQICAQLGCKPRGLWLNVADRCAGTLIWLMQEQGSAPTLAQLEAEVEGLIRVSGSPLSSRQVGLIQLSHLSHSQVFLDRATCCYWYKTEGGEYCSTCPKRTAEDRNARLLAYLAEKAQAQPAVVEAEALA